MPNNSSTRTGRSRVVVPTGKGRKIVRACTIRKEPAELFQFWRAVENLRCLSDHIISIMPISDIESRWRVRGLAKTELEWDAIIINEHRNELIAWESKPDAEIKNAGTIRFAPAPAGQGTEVTLSLDYAPPAGRLGAAIAKLIGEDPDLRLEEGLMRFKALMETGEMPTTAGQSSGRGEVERRGA